MTKQHFELIANVISHLKPEMRSYVTWAFITQIRETNPRFDVGRFLRACDCPPEAEAAWAGVYDVVAPHMLAGIAVYRVFFHRRTPRPPLALGSSLLPGFAAFLLSLPLVVLVGLAWTGLLKLCGLPVEPQDAVAFFTRTKSPVLLAAMIALAAIIAPITEDLIFRAGLFR
jgi:membrane protease YdiL (CAAX protease family)